MANVCRDGMRRASIGGTVSFTLAERLRVEENKSAILEEALADYYAKKDALPKPPVCNCSKRWKARFKKNHEKGCPFFAKEAPPKEKEAI